MQEVKLLNGKEAIEFLGVARSWFYRKVKSNEIPVAPESPESTRLYRLEDIQEVEKPVSKRPRKN